MNPNGSSMLWQNSVVRIIGVKSVIPIGPCDRDAMVLFAEGGSEGGNGQGRVD
jgi:hypothetical protein